MLMNFLMGTEENVEVHVKGNLVCVCVCKYVCVRAFVYYHKMYTEVQITQD
jgi:hypothetical protein